MNILFLDDDKDRQKAFKKKISNACIVSNVQECIDALSSGEEWDIVFLDHDLEGETFVDSERKDCGMEVARWIKEKQPFIRQIIVHTLNTQAGEAMTQFLVDAEYRTSYIPFTVMIKNLERYSA